jgi:hypothetical protein
MNLTDFIESLFNPDIIIPSSKIYNINFIKIAQKFKQEILLSESINKRNGYIKMIGKNTKYPLYFNNKIIITDDLIIEIIKHVYKNFFITIDGNIIFDKNILSKIDLLKSDIITKNIITIDLCEYNIYGCPLSTDCDIAFITTRENIENYKIYKSKSKQDLDYELILNFNSELEQLKKYPEYSNKDFDINLISVDSNNNITLCLNGSSNDTQNIIFHTYKYHRQKYNKFVNKMVDVDLFDKIRGLTSFVMKHIESILDMEKNEREIKKKMFVSDSSTQFRYAIHILSRLKINSCDKSTLKSISMKICQIILLNDDIYAYTKQEIINNMIQYINGENELWNILTRDVHGKYSELFNKQNVFNSILKLYIDIFNDISKSDYWTKIEIDFTTNPTQLPDDLIEEFFKSPLKPTDKFIQSAKKIDLLNSIDKHFILDTFGQEFISDRLNKHIHWFPQRSQEWKIYYQKYNSDKYTGINHDKYGLFRGALAELYILKNCNFQSIFKNPINKIMVGFIHNLNNIAAPDLLIQENTNIVPVEIKCLPIKLTTDITVKAFHRELKMAKKQLRYYKQILDEIHETTIKNGLLIFMFIDGNEIKTQWTLIDMG